jgi:bacteriocin biosynthesis cyclodehydratase domain-containing protein
MGAKYAIDPALPVLLRPDGSVQVGWHPRRAVLVRPPSGLTASGLAALLRAMQSHIGLNDLLKRACEAGLDDNAAFVGLLGNLVDANIVSAKRPARRARSASIRIHGRGPLSDLLDNGLRCSGARVRHTSHGTAGATADSTDLVVLSDYLVADPRLVRELQAAGTPHLAVRVRDGTGLIGPMVIPGVTSCLRCADLHRSDRDAAWPALAAQLRDTVGSADRATVLATAALALNQVDRVLRAVNGAAGPAPPTLDATLEFDVNANSILTRRWTRHPLCGC